MLGLLLRKRRSRDGCTHNNTLLIVEAGVSPASDTLNFTVLG